MADSLETTNAWPARNAAVLDWRWLCRLSLVEPAVAVAWHLALERSLSLPMAFDRTLLLFVCLWLVYMADRLLDVRRLSDARKPRTERHSFVYRHPRSIAVAWSATFVASVSYAVVTLSPREWIGGVCVCLFTAVYFWVVHRRTRTPLHLRDHGAKELGVASIFVVGSTLFVWTHSAFGTGGTVVTLTSSLVLFFALALQNLLLLARLERHIDAHHGASSIMRAGKHGAALETALAVGLIAAALVNVTFVATGTSAHGIPLAALLPLTIGTAFASCLLLFQSRLFPALDQDARHVVADLAVLVAAVPTLLVPAPFG